RRDWLSAAGVPVVAVGLSVCADVLGIRAAFVSRTRSDPRRVVGVSASRLLSSLSPRGLRSPTGQREADNVTMEQRAFVAVALMAAVLILYQVFLVPSHEPVAPVQRPADQASREPSKIVPPATAPSGGSATPALPMPAAPVEARPPQTITKVNTPLYDASVSSEGGKLQEFVLRYRGEKPMVSVGDLGPTGLVIANAGEPSGQVVPMRPSTDSLKVGPDRPSQDLILTGGLDGLRVTQTQTFHSDTYTIDKRIRVENAGS